MTTYRALLLGRPNLLGSTGPVPLTSNKGQALLWYLAAHPEQPISRAQLANLLWDGGTTDVVRRNLNVLLHRLRHTLPQWPLWDSDRELAWSGEHTAGVDVREFLDLAGAEPAAARRHPAPIDNLCRAANLWRGPFLAGFECNSEAFEEWLCQERQTWEQRMLALLATLTDAEAAEGKWDQVLTHAQQGLRIDPLRESLHRTVMLAHHRKGNRATALAQYQKCQEILAKELGTTPDLATVRLHDTIACGANDRVTLSPDPPALPATVHVISVPAAVPPGLPLVGRAPTPTGWR